MNIICTNTQISSAMAAVAAPSRAQVVSCDTEQERHSLGASDDDREEKPRHQVARERTALEVRRPAELRTVASSGLSAPRMSAAPPAIAVTATSA